MALNMYQCGRHSLAINPVFTNPKFKMFLPALISRFHRVLHVEQYVVRLRNIFTRTLHLLHITVVRCSLTKTTVKFFNLRCSSINRLTTLRNEIRTCPFNHGGMSGCPTTINCFFFPIANNVIRK